MIRAALAAVLLTVVAACTATPSPPTASPVVIATPTMTPAPATAAPSPSATRYANPVLGYALTLPAPWRVSECLSRMPAAGPFVGFDVFTTRTPSEEHALGAGGDTGGTGALAWIISVTVEVSGQQPADFAAAHAGGIGAKVQPTTLGGREAARLGDGTSVAPTYYVASAGRMYTITLGQGFEARPPLVTDAAFDAIVHSISFVTPTPRPTPTPVPTLSPAVEAVVDAVAAAFAASDADKLRDLMPPKCWFQSAGYQSSGTLVSREKLAEGLRASFAKGLKVTVEARPIHAPSPILEGAFWVWSDWAAYGSAPFTPQSTTQLVFDRIDGQWYWTGAIFNAGSLR